MKQVVDYVTGVHGYSQRRACRLTQQHRSTQRKVLRLDPRTALRQRMHEIVLTRLRFGYRRVHILLKREGWQVGKNVVYRLYREEGLCLRTKRPRRRKMAMHRQAVTARLLPPVETRPRDVRHVFSDVVNDVS